MTDMYLEAKTKIKALQNLEKHSAEEVVSWVKEAIDTQYPSDRKTAFAIVSKQNWNNIRSEIIRVAKAQNYEEIHKIREAMLNTDLLFNTDLTKKGIIIDGTLAVISNESPNTALFLLLHMINAESKDPKLETYLLYRYLAGRPKLSNGFRKKF
ncbi:MAG: hypothetical protein ABSB28_05500 [Candidatus Bathyarchaeia archaeon]